jgi:hypothetical protein
MQGGGAAPVADTAPQFPPIESAELPSVSESPHSDAMARLADRMRSLPRHPFHARLGQAHVIAGIAMKL